MTIINDETFDGDVEVESGGTLVTTVYYLSGNGNFTLAAGATLEIGSPAGITSDGSDGNIQMTGTLSYSPGANYVYSGIDPQVPGDGLPSSFTNLTIDNPDGLTLASTITVTGVLYLTDGIIHTGLDYALIVESTDENAIVGGSATSYVNGTLERGVDATNTNAYNFPIGNNPYTPVEVVFTSGGDDGTITATTTPEDHFDIENSEFDENYTVNRYWTLEASGFVNPFEYDATFNWVVTDEDGDFDWESARVGKYDGAWSYPAVSEPAQTETSTTITGQTSFSDF